MYFGSTGPLDREHLKRLKGLVKRTRTPFLSDHLCWGSVDGTFTHDLLPMPYTFAAAEVHGRSRSAQARDILEVPICVENVSSYAEFHASEMTEWEFLNEVVERADCGILLDVNNIYVSSQNHSFDPFEYLNAIPPDRVGQMHIAGHSKYEKYILDTHDHPVLDRGVEDCMPMPFGGAGRPIRCWSGTRIFPRFDEVHAEALKAEQFIQQVHAGGRRPDGQRRCVKTGTGSRMRSPPPELPEARRRSRPPADARQSSASCSGSRCRRSRAR